MSIMIANLSLPGAPPEGSPSGGARCRRRTTAQSASSSIAFACMCFELVEDTPRYTGQGRSGVSFTTIVVLARTVMSSIKAFVVQVYRIPSSSMEETLLTGDRVLVNKVVYHLRGIDRGDIVVFSGEGLMGYHDGHARSRSPEQPGAADGG